MPQFDERSILRQIDQKRAETISAYADNWRGMIREWRAPRSSDAVWLMYAAHYLFNTGGVKWAVDPVLLSNRVPEAGEIDANGLADLDFVLLTHWHGDHVDVRLWKQLEGTQCYWVVPEHMISRFMDETSPDETRIAVAVPGREISIESVRITPFDSPHSATLPSGEYNRVDSTGYHIETTSGSYLLPCDVRTYDHECLKPFAGVSAVFAHVFLGRTAALNPDPPLLDEFVEFYLACRPEKILLTHLYEFARTPEDCWLKSHAEKAARAFAEADHNIDIIIPEWFREIAL